MTHSPFSFFYKYWG